MAKKMLVRCRKCWENVAIQRETDPLAPCPLCGKAETYFHAMLPGKPKEKPDGTASPG